MWMQRAFVCVCERKRVERDNDMKNFVYFGRFDMKEMTIKSIKVI